MPRTQRPTHSKNEKISQAQKNRTKIACNQCRSSRIKCEGYPDSCRRCIAMKRPDCRYESIVGEERPSRISHHKYNIRFTSNKGKESTILDKKETPASPCLSSNASSASPLPISHNLLESSGSGSSPSLCFSSYSALLSENSQLNRQYDPKEEEDDDDDILNFQESEIAFALATTAFNSEEQKERMQIEDDMSSGTTPNLLFSHTSNSYSSEDMQIVQDEIDKSNIERCAKNYEKIEKDSKSFRKMISAFQGHDISQEEEEVGESLQRQRQSNGMQITQGSSLTQERFKDLMRDPSLAIIRGQDSNGNDSQTKKKEERKLFLDLSDIDRSNLTFDWHDQSTEMMQYPFTHH